jgi:hypothetical protein
MCTSILWFLLPKQNRHFNCQTITLITIILYAETINLNLEFFHAIIV